MKTISKQVKFNLRERAYVVMYEYNEETPERNDYKIICSNVDMIEITDIGRPGYNYSRETMYCFGGNWKFERYCHLTEKDAEDFIKYDIERLIKERDNMTEKYKKNEYERAKKTVEEYESKLK